MSKQALEQGLKRGAAENVFTRADLQLPAGAQSVVLQLRKQSSDLGQPTLPLIAHLGNQGPRLGHAVFEQLGGGHVTRVIGFGQGQVTLGQKRIQSMHRAILLRSDSSMLMRSMPSVYSAMRGRG
jgi:hypothetical protein